jgi:hypothetical protein
MKRCPQCEFIYEDDQSLCDMDGILLVFDSQKLPKPTKVSSFHWRSRIITAVAAVVLATVLVLVYHVSTRQSAKRNSYSPAGVTNSQSSDTHAATPVIGNPAEASAADSKPAEGPPAKEPDPKPTNSSGTKPAEPKKTKERPKAPTQKTSTQPQKEDSKVESLFKKTGRILKKPFKF